MTPQELAKITGQHLLFCGVDTYSWSLAQFKQAAQFAKAHGVDNLIVKVADGGNQWYGGMPGWRDRRNTILAAGIGVIPYTYSYGNKLGALDREIDILIAYMQDCGIVCMDAEAEWNGQVQWAQHLCGRVQGAGTFLVSTWADPSLQNWQGVIKALAPCTTVFMPQQYNNYLATFWGEFAANGATWLQPTVNLTQDFGANDPVGIAKNAYNQGHTAIGVWYYDTATANPSLLDAVYAAFPKRSGGNTMIPQGWTDDGTTLTANGHAIQGAIRAFVLSNNWDFGNVPLTDMEYVEVTQDYYPSGRGWRQIFNFCEVVCDEATGQVGIIGTGNELLGCRKERDALRQQVAKSSLPPAVIADIKLLVGPVARLATATGQ